MSSMQPWGSVQPGPQLTGTHAQGIGEPHSLCGFEVKHARGQTVGWVKVRQQPCNAWRSRFLAHAAMHVQPTCSHCAINC